MSSLLASLLALTTTLATPAVQPPPEHGDAIDISLLAEMRRHPVESYRCPDGGGGRAFKGLTRKRARELFGEPDQKWRPTGRGLEWRTSWRYYVTKDRSRAWGADSAPSAYFEFAFGPGDLAYALTCSHVLEGKIFTQTMGVSAYPEPDRIEKAVDSGLAIGAIRAILYSNRSPEEMLKGLARFVRPGWKRRRFERETGLQGFCIGGHGMTCVYSETGLVLAMDDYDRIRSISREEAIIDGITFPKMPISRNGFADPCYEQWCDPRSAERDRP